MPQQGWVIGDPVQSGGRSGGAGPNTGQAPAPKPGDWTIGAPSEPAPPTATARIIGPTLDAWNPVNMAKGAYGLLLATLSPEHRQQFLEHVVSNAMTEAQKGVETFQSGHPIQGAMQMAGGAPIIGPGFKKLGEGDIPSAIGEFLALGSQVATMKFPASVEVGALRNANMAERAAAEFGQMHGIPVDAATATGNAAVKGAQYLADRSITGSVVSGKAKAAQQAGLERVGGELAAQAHPTATTPYQAGESVTSEIGGVIDNLRNTANQAYGRLRQIEAKNVQTVQTGTRSEPALNVQGRPIPGQVRSVPIMEQVSLPVDMLPVKAALKPIYERLARQMPVAQQQASAGFRALQNIIEGKDVLSASLADADLSAIKNIARADNPALRDVSQGLAAKAVDELDAAVQQAVSRGGPDATKALLEGRTATRAKYQAADVLDQLRDEPVQAFEQATWAKDAGIDRLRAVARLAPNQLPKVGRAFLDNLIETATAEGGFGKGGTLWAKWNNLGPQTKALLFQQPGLASDLDNFFLLAKKIGETPNPSGTGAMVSLGAQGALLWTNPITGASAQIGTGALSALLHSPAGVKLLTSGLKIPIRSPASATWLTQFQKLTDEGKR